MKNFDFRNPTRIVFGKGTIERTGHLAAEYGKNILLHYGSGSIKQSGLYDSVVASLKGQGLNIIELAGVKPNPRLSLVREGIELSRKQNVDLILAVGGGSVIDSAKAIGVGIPYEGDVWDFFTGKAVPDSSIPVATILTIPAAGSEASTGSVITSEDGGYKRPLNSELNYPVFSILDPTTAYTLPDYQIACGTTDILAHMIERYFTNVPSVSLTDRLLEGAMQNIIEYAPQVLSDHENYDLWAEVMWTGTIAHNNILDTGRIGDWGSHDIEHELSGAFDIAHGAGLAIIIPAWMKHVLSHDVTRFAQYANRVWGVPMDHWNPEKTALEGIRRTEEHFRRMGLAVRLSEVGIHEDSFEMMADKATAGDTHTLGNFVSLTKDDIIAILHLAS